MRSPQAVRTALWLLSAGSAAYLAGVLVGSGPDGTAVPWIHAVLVGGCALVVLARAALVAAERPTWTSLGLGLAFSAVGDLTWSVVARMGHDEFPSVADGLRLTLYPCLFVGLMLLMRERMRHFRVSTWLDGLVSASGLAALVAALAFGRLTGGAEGDAVVMAVALAYPVGDLTLLAVVAGALALLGWRADRRWWALCGGLGLYAGADTISLLAKASGTFRDGTWHEALGLAAALVIAATSWQPTRRLSRDGSYGWVALIPSVASMLVAVTVLCVSAGHRVPALAVALATLTLLGTAARFAVSFGELTALAESRHQAMTDELTGLANRRSLLAALDQTRGRPSTGLLLVDLDRFKEINDSLGHHVGDELLVQVARRLRGAVRSQDFVARLGGDEFAVLLTTEDRGGTPGAETTPLATSELAAARIVAEMRAPFALDDVTLHVQGSVGIGVLPDHTDDPMLLLQRADVAMYTAKSSTTRIGVYRAEEDPHSKERLELLEELRTSLRDGGIICHFQPKIDLRLDRVVGVEALARWNHPTRGLVPPDQFLGLAEHAGLMRELTAAVLGSALGQARRWREQGAPLPVAVNLSPTNLLDVDLPEQILQVLVAHDLPPDYLELEITETVMMTNPVRCKDVLVRLHALGVRTAIDDYGTGYSSLAYLQDLAVDVLKLDRAFVSRMTTDPRAEAIVRSTIDLAHSLGMAVVAEGVEDVDTVRALRGYGCDISQGFFHSPPLAPADLGVWRNTFASADRPSALTLVRPRPAS